MKNVILPTIEQLEPLLNEATESKSEADFVASFTKNAIEILTSRPMMYRSYGMYWWAVKELIVNSGFTGFGETLESGVLGTFNYERKAALCCAAWAYSTDSIDAGNIYSSTHSVATTDGNDMDYYLEDMEMEALIMGGSN